ncbi:hypothetical protein ZWY2020_004260 [Hordeum vulgare]|nr:hypothetical protein ZWY2020_004260 [Hordeum vulgare]
MARDLAATDPLAPFLRAVFVSMSRRLLRRGTPKTPTPPFPASSSPAPCLGCRPLRSSAHEGPTAIAFFLAAARDTRTDEGKKDLIESPPGSLWRHTAALPELLGLCCFSPLGRRSSGCSPAAATSPTPPADARLRTTPTCLLYRAIVAPPHPSIAALLAVEQPRSSRRKECGLLRRFGVEMGTACGQVVATSTASALGGRITDRWDQAYTKGGVD